MPLQPVVLLHSPRLAFLRKLQGPFRVREVPDWAGLAGVLPSQHPSSVVVLDPYGDADSPSEAFWELLERFPSVAIVPALEAAPDRVPHMRAMMAAGASEILNLYREDGSRLAAARIRSAFARPFKRRIDAALARYAGVEARTILTAAAEVAVRGGGPGHLADAFGVRAKTLCSWCGAHGLPLPRRLLGWLRILLAAHLLEDAGRTRATVAAACGYRTDRSLRRIIQRFVGPTSGEPLFDAAARAFRVELRELREAARTSASAAPQVANPMQDADVQSYPGP
jgi:AraC-like DNA-binding protein